MTIITVPHQTLREVAQPITKVDQKLQQFIKELSQTLQQTKNPSGVGLAAPQVDKKWRIFATNLPIEDDAADEAPLVITLFINPVITAQNREVTFGPDSENPLLEGCLSIPGLYGAVPRFQEITIEYQSIENDQLIEKKLLAKDFRARVIQHELDHLNGILFTDYSLEYDLPVYRENEKNNKFTEIDKRILESF
ncbi:MAG: peptide deformylase [bacterium]|nr:peptide deformylase [bacterium]